MGKDSFYEQLFECKCSKRKLYTWLSKVDDHKCVLCHKKLIPIYEDIDTAPTVIIASKHANGRLPAERNSRRTNHFNREILPTLSLKDQRYFKSKNKK
jgi:hypothetical protein